MKKIFLPLVILFALFLALLRDGCSCSDNRHHYVSQNLPVDYEA